MVGLATEDDTMTRQDYIDAMALAAVAEALGLTREEAWTLAEIEHEWFYSVDHSAVSCIPGISLGNP